MQAAIIEDGVVTGIIVADAAVDTCPVEDALFVNVPEGEAVVIGSTYDGESFHLPSEFLPVEQVPDSITPRQLRLFLLSQGLLDTVEAMVTQQDRATQIAWEFAIDFRRDDPLLNGIGQALGLTSEQIDAFFIAASKI